MFDLSYTQDGGFCLNACLLNDKDDKAIIYKRKKQVNTLLHLLEGELVRDYYGWRGDSGKGKR